MLQNIWGVMSMNHHVGNWWASKEMLRVTRALTHSRKKDDAFPVAMLAAANVPGNF